MKRTHLFALLMTLAASNVLAASMQQSPKQIPLGQGAPVENQLMLTQNTPTQTPSAGTGSSGSIEGKSAGGELQTTIIDDNGNLKVVPKNNANTTNNAGTSNQPGTTTPGMAAEAPARPKQAPATPNAAPNATPATPAMPNAQTANPAQQGNQPPYLARPPVAGQPNGAPVQPGQTPPAQPPLAAPTPPAATTPPMAVPNQAPTPATPNGAMPPTQPATR